jgi:flagellar biosynthetic protein FliP
MKKAEKFRKILKIQKIIVLVCVIISVLALAGCSVLKDSASATASSDAPLNGILGDRQETIDIVLLLTVLTILPSILIMLTGFTRIIIVLSLIRNGLGLQQMPPNQVLIGLALFLTFFVMSPVIDDINKNAYQPYIKEQITQEQAIDSAMKPIRTFMLKQTYKTDLEFFMSVSEKDKTVKDIEKVANTTLIPAFITSEIKRGFQIGFFIYIPFIVIDMIVASTLMSMGMMMLPPIVISLPFKLLLFVVVDGWTLTIKTLLSSFT